jgi:GNAT superfamily N-acetyltransferase
MDPLVLADGTTLPVRALEPADKPLLREGMKQLSPDSRYKRFFTATTGLSDAQLTYLTEVDHRSHEALVASDPETGEGIAVARYVRLSERPDTAEIAIAVVDRWQGRGVGRALLHVLAETARPRGISHFVAVMLVGNQPMIRLITALGHVESRRVDGETVEITVELAAEADVPPPR